MPGARTPRTPAGISARPRWRQCKSAAPALVRALEYYNGKLIAYSPGDSVFYRYSHKTGKAVILERLKISARRGATIDVAGDSATVLR